MKNRITDYLPAAWRPGTRGRPPQDAAGMGVSGLLEPVEKLVSENPVAALAAAFAAGVALAWWIKRK